MTQYIYVCICVCVYVYHNAYIKLIVSNELSRRCKNIKSVALLKKTIPLIDWLSSYDWKNNISGDIVAGITVAVMHIPQGMLHLN